MQIALGNGTLVATVPGDPPPVPGCIPADEGAFGVGTWTVLNAAAQPRRGCLRAGADAVTGAGRRPAETGDVLRLGRGQRHQGHPSDQGAGIRAGSARAVRLHADAGRVTTGARPASTSERQAAEAVLHTNRGDLTVTLAADQSLCGTAAFAHLVRGGFYEGQPCHHLETGESPALDCGAVVPDRAGVAFPTEVSTTMTYPAGTVVLSRSGPYTDAGSIRIVTGKVPYLSTFTVLGRLTSGSDVVRAVAASGASDYYGPPNLPLTLTGIDLR